MFAIDPQGYIRGQFWEFESIESSPAIGNDGTIYFGTFAFDGMYLYESYLYALNSFLGFKWRFPMGPIHSSPAIGSDGTIYVGSWDNYLYAINANGTLKWKFLNGGDSSSPAIGANGTIYVGSGNYLYAIDPDGTMKWRYLTDSRIGSSPSIDVNGVIYVGSYDNYLYAINEDGSLKWRFLTGGDISSSPAIGIDGTIFIGSKDNYLYAVTADGSLKWRTETNGWVRSSPAIGSDGTVYVGSWDGFLYSVGLPEGQAGIYGQVIDQSNGSKIEGATITIGTATTSSELGGDYKIALAPGSYTLTCIKEGYEAITITNVDLSAGSPLKFDFSMTASSNDSDGDGLPDDIETNGCTEIDIPDTDSDGILDGDEDANHNGSQDAGETDPCDDDSDDDLMTDGWEVDNNLNPLIDDADGDADNDLFTNLREFNSDTQADDPADRPSVSQGFDADLDVDGLDLYRFVNGLNSGVVNESDLQGFAAVFGR